MNPGVHAAIAAAQEEERRKQQEEEEMMTKYSDQELNENWEFKIVRTNVRRFHKPEIFQSLLQEEAVAGWDLVEKLDDQRVRFKRPRTARRRDDRLPPGVDPYRTQYGRNVQISAAIIAGVVAFLLGMGVFVAIFFQRMAADPVTSAPASSSGSPIILVVVIGGIVIGLAATMAVLRGRNG